MRLNLILLEDDKDGFCSIKSSGIEDQAANPLYILGKFFAKHDRAKAAVDQLVAIRLFRRSELDLIQKDLVKIIARKLWESRDDGDIWCK